ncbi:Centrosomal protein of 76 kDa [Pleodorina starrii]|nr:Centrosomal protein of 76 kDa [Pleodorina starrii]
MEDTKVVELRKAVRQQLQQAGVQGVLHQLLLEYQRTGEAVTPEDALDVLQGRGVIDQLVRTVRPPQTAVEALTQVSNVGPVKPAELPTGKAFLHVKLLGGRAFADYVVRIPGPEEQLQLSLELFGQRFTTQPVAAAVEPAFAGEAFFQLPTGSGPADPLQLLALRQGMHIVVMQLNPLAAMVDGQWDLGPGPAAPAAAATSAPEQVARQLSVRRLLCALGTAEWRTALRRRGKVVVSVQLGAGPGASGAMPASTAPAGMLTLQLELRPAFSAALDEALLKSQQRMEHARDADVMAAFVAGAKAWWGEYASQNLAFKARPIKVLATGEDGSQYPVCCFVRPLQLGRALANAREAARFVSLLRRREDLAALPSGGLSEVAECWCQLHTVLAAGTATKEEMAVLLCSLLLGFGLDAWVVVGRLHDGSGHTWVMTRGPLASPCFWEPSTAVRYSITDVDTWPYQSVGCVFNNLRLYANSQGDDSAFGTSYVLEDASLWRELPMPPQELPAMPWSAIPLARSAIPDPLELEAHLEARLRSAAAQHRRQVLGAEVATAWDDGLAQLLMPALAAYEQEAVSGEVAPGNDEFQQAIKRAVPLGWVFKAMPQHHSHVCADLMRKALLEDDQMLDILGATAGTASFALRVKVFAYPECLTSVWMMLAVKYSAVAP